MSARVVEVEVVDNQGVEPDWSMFAIDKLHDPPGVQERKVHGFMAAFIKWRQPVVVPAEEKPKVRPNRGRRKRTSK